MICYMPEHSDMASIDLEKRVVEFYDDICVGTGEMVIPEKLKGTDIHFVTCPICKLGLAVDTNTGKLRSPS